MMAVSKGVSADDRLAEIEDLYRTRFRDFLRVAIAITGSPELGVEAVQDAFGDAIRSRRNFRGEGSLAAWVWRLVVNASRDARRQVADVPVEPTAIAERSNGRVDSSELRAAIAALPERQRLVLFLRYYADLDYRGIAVTLEIKTGTVSAMLNQAHRALRSVLDEVEA